MSPPFLDSTGKGIFARNLAGSIVALVLPDPATGGPGVELPAARLWRTDPGLGAGIDTLTARWREIVASGEQATNKARATVRKAAAVREFVAAALETGDADLLVAALDEAQGLGANVPEVAMRGVRAVAALQNQALATVEAAIPNPSAPGWLATLGKAALVGASLWGASKVLGAVRRKR